MNNTQHNKDNNKINNNNNNNNNNNKTTNNIIIQITLFDSNNRYKPVSTLIEVESIKYYKEHKQEIHTKAIQKICAKRQWTARDLLKYNYTKLKARNYSLYLKGKREKDNEKE